MKFGRLDTIGDQAFTLPEDHPITAITLNRERVAKPAVHIGCPVWSEPKLKGILYPKHVKPKDFLRYYATQFNSIELNATGYGAPTKEELATWLDAVKPGFKFFPKVPKWISGSNPIAKNAQAVEQWEASLEAMGKNLGVVFMQFAPNFAPKRKEDLMRYISETKFAYELHIELRHEGWFDGSHEDLFELMRKKKIGFVITDVTDRRDALHMCLTTPSAFIRFDGHDLADSDLQRLDEWASRIAGWLDRGLKSLYFFVHTPKKELNPILADHFIAQLNVRGGLDIARPALLVDSKRLTSK